MSGGTPACSGWLEQSHLCYSVSSCPSTLCQAKLQCKAWSWADGYLSLVWTAGRSFAFIFSSCLFPPVIRFNNRNFPLFSFLFADNLVSLERCHPVRHHPHRGEPEHQTGAGCPHARLLRGREYLLPQVQREGSGWCPRECGFFMTSS